MSEPITRAQALLAGIDPLYHVVPVLYCALCGQPIGDDGQHCQECHKPVCANHAVLDRDPRNPGSLHACIVCDWELHQRPAADLEPPITVVVDFRTGAAERRPS